MAIKTAPTLFIDLTGPDGNAFVLLAYARHLAKQLGIDGREITRDMKAGISAPRLQWLVVAEARH